MTDAGFKPIRPLLQWFVGILVVAGFALSTDQFAVEGVNPIAIFGIGMFLVGFSSIDDFRKVGFGGVKLYVSAMSVGLAFVGLMLAIVAIVNSLF